MNGRKKTILIASIMTLGLLSTFTIGLSSWLIVNKDVIGGNASIVVAGINNDDIGSVTDSKAFKYEGLTAPKMGKYFYEEGETGKSTTGTIVYTFTITPNRLPSSLKGMKLTVFGSLSLVEGTEKNTTFFSDYTYIDNGCVWSCGLSGGTVQAKKSADGDGLDIGKISLGQPSAVSTFKVEFKLKQQCILNASIREKLLSSNTKFNLQLKVGTEQ